MKKRVISLFLVCSLILPGIIVSASASSGALSNFTKQTNYREGQYSDVSAGDWFSENVKAGTEYGIVKGYGDRFGVQDNITILQSIIIACRIHTIYHNGKDKIEQTYSGSLEEKYAAYAQEHGIPSSFADRNAAATRAEFAEILSYALPEEALKKVNQVEDGVIPDVSGTETYAAAVYRLYQGGILTGSDNKGTFKPSTLIARAEACTIATRMIDPSLRVTFAFRKNGNIVFSWTGDTLYPKQWALFNDGTFCLKEKENEEPVYEFYTSKPYAPYEWEVRPFFEERPQDPTVYSTSGIDIGLEKARKLYQGGSRETIVAIIDTGVDIEHEELKDSIWTNKDEIPNNGIDDDHNGYIDDIHGWNYADNNNQVYVSPKDDHHGTHCAGTIVANAENGIGVAGIAYSKNIKIMVLKVFGNSTQISREETVAKAIQYAEDKGAVICNLSLSYNVENKEVSQAMQNSKMLFIAAAGNNGYDLETFPLYPAGYEFENIISVANLTSAGKLYSKSNYGDKEVDLAAPGSYVLSTTPENTYSYMSGTSMAAPMVTGAAAMIYSHYPSITPAQVKELILRTVRPLESLKGKCVTGGMLDLGAAMQYDISQL